MSEIEKCKECGNKEIYQDNLCFKCFGKQLFSGLGEKSKEQQLQEEIERLHTIIKEVREEIEYFVLQAKHLDDNIYLDEKLTNKLLEILDKENI